MYKPNFCAECGARIEGARRHWWNRRNFCDGCAVRLRRAGIVWTFASVLALIVAAFIAGRTTRQTAPPLIIERAGIINFTSAAQNSAGVSPDKNAYPLNAGAPHTLFGPDGTMNERPTDPHEIISLCGARTRKGTPCQRRVRGTGRCWQHTGMPAIIPLEKRMVMGN